MIKTDVTPPLSVVLCTYNPRADLIARALRAISRQTLAPEEYEVVVVDNNSSPPLDSVRMEALAGRPVRTVVEPRQGLTYARVCGINSTYAELLCFIDDDNEISDDYLENAISIARAEPNLGTFGGAANGILERRIGAAKSKFLHFLGVRSHGPETLTGSGERWGPWEPIGAGLCVRRDIAEGYVTFVENTKSAGGLGRTGGALLSGEDSLISRIAHRKGYMCGYRPSLNLRHHITASRLSLNYIARLMEGHGRSHVLLETICSRPPEITPKTKMRQKLLMNYLHRLKSEGFAQACGMFFWDLGHFRQSHEPGLGESTATLDDTFESNQQLKHQTGSV